MFDRTAVQRLQSRHEAERVERIERTRAAIEKVVLFIAGVCVGVIIIGFTGAL